MSFKKVPIFLGNLFEIDMNGNETTSYRFRSFLLDVGERQLFQEDRLVPLTPKVFDVLAHLVEHSGHLVLKDELMKAVWPDSFVDEVNLPRAIHTIRKALAEDKNGNRFIETVPTKGYRFVATVNGGNIGRFEPLKDNFEIGVASQLRRNGEFELARDHAKKCLEVFQANRDWVNVAEAYREIGLGHLREGNCVISLTYFESGIETIGDNAAPIIRGKLYTDMAGAYWHLRRPKDGIDYLEKAVKCFNGPDHIPRLITALNNLGLSLTLNGEWKTAEKTFKSAITLAVRIDSASMPNILDSLAELKILKGNYAEAERLLLEAIDFAKDRNQIKEAIHAVRNLGRCYMVQGRFKEAVKTAHDALGLCDKATDSRYIQMSNLVLAESYLNLGGFGECKKCLKDIEEHDNTCDYFVLAEIQRIQGLFSLEVADKKMALEHFSRCRQIFEKGSDFYHMALADYLIGTNLSPDQKILALEHLKPAYDFFSSHNIKSKKEECINIIKKIEQSFTT